MGAPPSVPVFDESPFVEFVLKAQEHLLFLPFRDSLEEGDRPHEDQQECQRFHGSLPIGRGERSKSARTAREVSVPGGQADADGLHRLAVFSLSLPAHFDRHFPFDPLNKLL